ncbi:MAG TPA: methylase [Oceanospirillaceae bacterium]|mgnify:CR=1 FL=1|nr:methylase [Oceanospirillaceae bacterium]
MEKPFSQACANNQTVICEVLERVFADKKNALEVGSGTGQHGVYFAKNMPHLNWQTSDRAQNHAGIKHWIKDNPAPNLLAPIALDVLSDSWPTTCYDAVFSANTAHIMPWQAVVAMFAGVGERLLSGGVFCLYGPMKYHGVLAAQSNVRFDAWLQQQVPHQGIREFQELNQLAMDAGLTLQEDNAMPANNQLIVWQKQ